jgi:hypothetical protein
MRRVIDRDNPACSPTDRFIVGDVHDMFSFLGREYRKGPA